MIIGEKAPDFNLPSSNGDNIKLSDYLGQKVIIYFYPKDNTPGWKLEAEGFNEYLKEFSALNTVVFGISKDSIKSHINFSNKLNLNFKLLSDTEKEVHKLYETWKLKKMFGKEYYGTVRSTFIIDEEGILIKEYRNVKVKGHVGKVLEFVGNLN